MFFNEFTSCFCHRFNGQSSIDIGMNCNFVKFPQKDIQLRGICKSKILFGNVIPKFDITYPSKLLL